MKDIIRILFRKTEMILEISGFNKERTYHHGKVKYIRCWESLPNGYEYNYGKPENFLCQLGIHKWRVKSKLVGNEIKSVSSCSRCHPQNTDIRFTKDSAEYEGEAMLGNL